MRYRAGRVEGPSNYFAQKRWLWTNSERSCHMCVRHAQDDGGFENTP